ncbi:hypothetical protein HanPSC8_Chr08g0337991 [Helianthus annuus]|nr:hypothetical protein HanPSC8_Chr08g0337991 [Helianthus annuus]
MVAIACDEYCNCGQRKRVGCPTGVTATSITIATAAISPTATLTVVLLHE